MEEMMRKEGDKDNTIALAQEILAKCHPDAVPVIRHWITIIQSRWEEVMAWANQVRLFLLVASLLSFIIVLLGSASTVWTNTRAICVRLPRWLKNFSLGLPRARALWPLWMLSHCLKNCPLSSYWSKIIKSSWKIWPSGRLKSIESARPREQTSQTKSESLRHSHLAIDQQHRMLQFFSIWCHSIFLYITPLFFFFDRAPDRDFSQSPTRESSPEHDVQIRRGR